ncbi:MAG: tetratricopeptide repeat protein, partial [Bacteroidetes bacterium]|nr:tetratricopeptide repeat protein [Bacteroidota bacterium]
MLYFCAANAQNHGIAISINTFNLDTILKYRDKDPFISLQYLHKAQSNAQNLPEHSTIAEILYHKGYIYRQLGLYDIALTNYLWSLSIADKAKDRCLDAWVLLDIANLYRDKKNSDKLALEYYENARKRFSDYQDLIGSIVTNFSEAELHMNNRSYNTAIHLLEIANSTSSMLGEKNQKAKVLMLLGQVYLQKKEPSKANAYFGELMRLGSDKKSSEMMASAYKGYASIAIFKGKINEGITFFFAALECYKRINDKTNIVFTLDKIGQTYFENGNFSDASKHTEMALVAAENNNYIIQQRILLKKLSIYYAASKDFETANTKQNKYIALLENEAINNSALIQNEYKMEAQRKENAALNNWTKNQRMLISICIFSGLAFLMLLFVAVTKNKKLQESHINLLAKGTELQKKKNELIALNTQ